MNFKLFSIALFINKKYNFKSKLKRLAPNAIFATKIQMLDAYIKLEVEIIDTSHLINKLIVFLNNNSMNL